MYYELSEMDSFVEIVYQSALHHQPIKGEIQVQWKQNALVQPGQMKQQLLKEIFNQTEEKAVHLLVQNVQMVLTNLINKVQVLSVLDIATKNDKDFVAIVFSLQKGLNDLFEFIEYNLTHYMGRSQLIPVTHHQKAIQDLSIVLQGIKEQYAVLAIDTSLLQIALQPVEYFISEKLSINFHELDYYHLLLKKIQSLPFARSKEFNTPLMQLLNRFNFNDGAYLHYLIERFKVILLEADSLQDQIDACLLELKFTNQWQLQTSLALYPDMTTIQFQFGNWLKKEIQYLQSAVALQAVPEGHPQNPMLEDTKINLDISVGVFAFLLRLLCATGIILNKNKADIIRFFSAYFRTVRSENIPYKHLRNLFDVPRSSSINIGREVLKKLLLWVDKI
jgi:hypothetical protein